jgi:hypothetical protein
MEEYPQSAERSVRGQGGPRGRSEQHTVPELAGRYGVHASRIYKTRARA